MVTEADTCRKYVLPKLHAAGWDDDRINEQRTITDGQILVVGDLVRRRQSKRVDYLLRYDRDRMLAVVEAKAEDATPGKGIQQAMQYAAMLDIKFAYSTNGRGIIEHDFITGKERSIERFPTPDELLARTLKKEGIVSDEMKQIALTPTSRLTDKPLRYYQEVAVNRTIGHIVKGNHRVLLTMATGTGKTLVAFQIIWKLWNARWNAKGDYRRPRVLYLADRDILVDDPKDNTFLQFGDARQRIEGEAVKSREIYFSTYQAIAKDERRPGLYRQYPPDFFDLVVVDECHRGSARDESNWREILEYFAPACQIGMTATPKRNDNVDTYKYFGNPIYMYTLREGIEDGFLAPYIVRRVVSSADAFGWRPISGERDKLGRLIPAGEYGTRDFERSLSLKARTEAIANNITQHLKETDRFAKTIVFCVDMEHAEHMRMALVNANSDLAKQYPDYVVRIVSEEGVVGKGHLGRFKEVDSKTPVIATTSQLLTTGVDIPTCKNIVLVKHIESLADFKQIIGRGTRIRDDYGKLFFTILDYTGSATRLFADPEFDGEPALLTQEEMDEHGKRTAQTIEAAMKLGPQDELGPPIAMQGKPKTLEPGVPEPRKYYVDGETVSIIAEMVYELDARGNQIRAMKYTDYTRDKVRSMYTKAADLRSKWGNPEERVAIVESLEDRGVSLEKLAEVTKMYDADRFDLLCHVAFNAPLRTRRERAESVKRNHKDFFEQYSSVAREILNEILDKYVEFGMEQFKLPDILKIAPIDKHGNVIEIADTFGNSQKLRAAVDNMQNMLYQEVE